MVSIHSVLARLERQSMLEKTRKIDVPSEKRMLAITPQTARFYHDLLIRVKAKNILELGMSVGYSTLYFVDAMLHNHKNPRITTLEHSPLKIKMAESNFEAAKVTKFIKIRHGEILDTLRKTPLDQKFDFVLIDADKENIIEYFDLILPMVNVGGIIATDNVLLPRKYQKFMNKYKKHIKSHRNVLTGTIPLGYGQEITIKIA